MLFDEVTDLRVIKYFSFQLFNDQSRKSLAQVSKVATFLAQNFSELPDQAELDAHWWEVHSVSVHPFF